jgi:membrane-associated phospholipid phosphatase
VKAILKNNLSFLIPYFVFLLIGAGIIIFNSKEQTHLSFNSFHNSFLDTVNTYTTYLGDGFTAALLVIMMLGVKYRYFLILAIANITSALIAHALKHFVFDDVVRPKKFFEGLHELYFVPGIDNHLYNSFPSGHTTCAFALYCSLALIVKNRTYKILFLILGLLTGYSRIYLSQHFFEDVYAGSIIGVTFSILVFYFVQRKKHPWMNHSITNFFKNER